MILCSYLTSFKRNNIVSADSINGLWSGISRSVKCECRFAGKQFHFRLLRTKIPLHSGSCVGVKFYSNQAFFVRFHRCDFGSVVAFFHRSSISRGLAIYSVQWYSCVWSTNCQYTQTYEIKYGRFIPFVCGLMLPFPFESPFKKSVKFRPKWTLHRFIWPFHWAFLWRVETKSNIVQILIAIKQVIPRAHLPNGWNSH